MDMDAYYRGDVPKTTKRFRTLNERIKVLLIRYLEHDNAKNLVVGIAKAYMDSKIAV